MENDIQTLLQQIDDLHDKFVEIEDSYSKLQKQFKLMESLSSIISALTAITDFDELLRFSKSIFKTSFSINQFSLMLFDEKSNHLNIKSHFGLRQEWTKTSNYLNETTIFFKAIQSQKHILVEDTSEVNDKLTLFPGIKKYIGSFLCIPMICEKNKTLGVLNLYRNGRNSFNIEEIELFTKATKQFANSLNNILLYEHTKELSITDDLTGFSNRRYFNQRYEREIQRAKRYHHTLCLLMLDIDHFKVYNDLNGHILGDEVLKKVALTLDKILRKSDFIARYGGEEFVIMLPEISKAQAREVANKLRSKIEKTEFTNEETLPNKQLTISLGLAVSPDDSMDPKTLIQYADDALYIAKSLGRNCIAWHGMKIHKAAKHS